MLLLVPRFIVGLASRARGVQAFFGANGTNVTNHTEQAYFSPYNTSEPVNASETEEDTNYNVSVSGIPGKEIARVKDEDGNAFVTTLIENTAPPASPLTLSFKFIF